MSSVKFQTANGLTLTYLVDATTTAYRWLQLLKAATPTQLLRSIENHKHGFASEAEVAVMLSKLQETAASLELEPLAAFTRAELNRLHVSFVDSARTVVKQKQLRDKLNKTRMTINLIIHWLEHELDKHQLFNFDFNHANYQLCKIPEAELGNFSPVLEFGSLHLHYCYIGRHFLEMVHADDMVAHAYHFRPQLEFNATCGLVFGETLDAQMLEQRMLTYYAARGGQDFFKLAYNDPKLTKGFFQLGKLANIAEYSTKQSRDALRAQLRDDYFISWEVL